MALISVGGVRNTTPGIGPFNEDEILLGAADGKIDTNVNFSFTSTSGVLRSSDTSNSIVIRTASDTKTPVSGTGTSNVAIGYRSIYNSVSTGSRNVAIGNNTMGSYGVAYDITGDNNVAIGRNALNLDYNPSRTGGLLSLENIAIGQYALRNLQGIALSNIAIGTNAGRSIGDSAISTDNIAIGSSALGQTNFSNSTVGDSNVVIGDNALAASGDHGDKNIAIGWQALNGGIAGNNNIAIGGQSLGAATTRPTGNHNISIGYNSLGNCSTLVLSPNYSIVIGYRAAENVDTGNYSILIGAHVAKNATDTGPTIGIGRWAVSALTSTVDLVAIGNYAADGVTTGDNSVVLGGYSLATTTNLYSSVVIGSNAGSNASTVGNAVFIGEHAGRFTESAIGHIAMGYSAMRGDTNARFTGANNIAIGNQSMRITSNLVNSTGSHNIAIGYSTLREPTSANNNVLIGQTAGRNLTTGSRNIFLGQNAGAGDGTGNDNVFLGKDIGQSTTTLENYNVGIGVDVMSDQTYVGFNNIAIGRAALWTQQVNTSTIAIGSFAGAYSITNYSILIGDNAGASNFSTPGDVSNEIIIGNGAGAAVNGSWTGDGKNIVLGNYVLGGNVIGANSSVVIGHQSFFNTGQTITNTVSIGAYTGGYAATVNDSVFIGKNAGERTGNTGNNRGNVAVGYSALRGESASRHSGQYNTAIGYRALDIRGTSVNLTGGNNIAIGSLSGREMRGTAEYNIVIASGGTDNITTGSGNVLIGYSAALSAGTESNRLVIDSSATAKPLIEGSFSSAYQTINGELRIANATANGSGSIVRTSSEEEVDLSLGTDTQFLSIPSGARLLGASFKVRTAVVTSGATNTWGAAFITGSTTSLLPDTTSGALNTTANTMIADEITTATTEVRFDAAGAETFTSGLIAVQVYYETLLNLE